MKKNTQRNFEKITQRNFEKNSSNPIAKFLEMCYNGNSKTKRAKERGVFLKHVVTINKANLKASAEKGGCGKCQSSCQSACKTSCGVANQKCENTNK